MGIRTILLTGIAATVATIGLASSAMAASTDANGVVTVSKGDVQTAMGWNNDQFQANVTDVTFTGTSSVTGPGDEAHMITSPTTGEWHDYGFSHVTGSINKPEDCQWATAWGFEADVWQPAKATVTATPVKNSQGKVTGWTLTSTGYSTTRSNHVWCDMGGAMGGYDRTTTEYFTGGSLASVQVNGKNVPVTPYVAPAL